MSDVPASNGSSLDTRPLLPWTLSFLRPYRAKVITLPLAETERRWKETTV